MLDRIDWAILRSRDFKRDPEDPGKFERYQAEALIYKYLPIDGVLEHFHPDWNREAILG